MYEGYHYWGMHLIWWGVWLFFIFWIFALPYRVPGQRHRTDTPLDTLKKRLAAGIIDKEEFKATKELLEAK